MSCEVTAEFGKIYSLQNLPEGNYLFKNVINIRGDLPIPLMFSSYICTPRLTTYAPLWNHKGEFVNSMFVNDGIGIIDDANESTTEVSTEQTEQSNLEKNSSEQPTQFKIEDKNIVNKSKNNKIVMSSPSLNAEPDRRIEDSGRNIVDPFNTVFSTKQDLMNYATLVKNFYEKAKKISSDDESVCYNEQDEDKLDGVFTKMSDSGNKFKVYKKYYTPTKTLNFGSLNIGLKKSMIFLLTNTQNIPASFSITNKALMMGTVAQRKLQSQLPERFTFEPSSGIIAPGQDFSIAATFIPWDQSDVNFEYPKTFKSEFIIRIKNGDDLKITVIGNALPNPISINPLEEETAFKPTYLKGKNKIILTPTIPNIPSFSEFILSNNSSDTITVCLGKRNQTYFFEKDKEENEEKIEEGLYSYVPDLKPVQKQEVPETPPPKQEIKKRVSDYKARGKSRTGDKSDAKMMKAQQTCILAAGEKLSSYSDYDKWLLKHPKVCISVIFSQYLQQVIPVANNSSIDQLYLDIVEQSKDTILVLDIDDILSKEIASDTNYSKIYKDIELWRNERNKAMTEYVIQKEEWKKKRRTFGLSAKITSISQKDKNAKQIKKLPKDLKQGGNKQRLTKQQQQQQQQLEEICGLCPVKPTLSTDPRATSEYKQILKDVFAQKIKSGYERKMLRDPENKLPFRIILINILTKKAHCSQVIQAIYECSKDLGTRNDEINEDKKGDSNTIISPFTIHLNGGAVVTDLYNSPLESHRHIVQIDEIGNNNDRSLSEMVKKLEEDAREANVQNNSNIPLSSFRGPKPQPLKTSRGGMTQGSTKNGKMLVNSSERKTIEELIDKISNLTRFNTNDDFMRKKLRKSWKKIIKTMTMLAKRETLEADEKKQLFMEQHPELDSEYIAQGGMKKGKHKQTKPTKKMTTKQGSKVDDIDYSELEYKIHDFLEICNISALKTFINYNLSSLMIRPNEQMCNIDLNKFVEDEFPIPMILPVQDKNLRKIQQDVKEGSQSVVLDKSDNKIARKNTSQKNLSPAVLDTQIENQNSDVITSNNNNSNNEVDISSITIEKTEEKRTNSIKKEETLIFIPEKIELWYTDPRQMTDLETKEIQNKNILHNQNDRKKGDINGKQVNRTNVAKNQKVEQNGQSDTQSVKNVPTGYIFVNDEIMIKDGEEAISKCENNEGNTSIVSFSANSRQEGKIPIPCSITLAPHSSFPIYVKFLSDNLDPNQQLLEENRTPSPISPSSRSRSTQRRSRPGTSAISEMTKPEQKLIPVVKENVFLKVQTRPFCQKLGYDISLTASSVIPSIDLISTKEEQAVRKNESALLIPYSKLTSIPIIEYNTLIKLLNLEAIDKEFPLIKENSPASSISNTPSRSSSRLKTRSSSQTKRQQQQQQHSTLSKNATDNKNGSEIEQPPMILQNIRAYYKIISDLVRPKNKKQGEDENDVVLTNREDEFSKEAIDSVLIFPIVRKGIKHQKSVTNYSKRLIQSLLNKLQKQQQQQVESQKGQKQKRTSQQQQNQNNNNETIDPIEENDENKKIVENSNLLPQNVELFTNIESEGQVSGTNVSTILIQNTQNVPAAISLTLKSWSDPQLRTMIASSYLDTIQTGKNKKAAIVDSSITSPFECVDLESVISCIVGAGVELTEKVINTLSQNYHKPSPFMISPSVAILQPGEKLRINISCSPNNIGTFEDELIIDIWRSSISSKKCVKLLGFCTDPSAKVMTQMCQSDIAPSPPSVETLLKITPPDIKKLLGFGEETVKGNNRQKQKGKSDNTQVEEQLEQSKISLVALPRVPRYRTTTQNFSVCNTSLLPISWRISLSKTNVYEYESMYVVPQFEPDNTNGSSSTSKLLLYQKLPETQPLPGSQTPPRSNSLIIKFSNGNLSSYVSVCPCSGYLGPGQQLTVQIVYHSQYESSVCIPLQISMWEVNEIDACTELLKYIVGKIKPTNIPSVVKSQMITINGGVNITIPQMPLMPDRFSKSPLITTDYPPSYENILEKEDENLQKPASLFGIKHIHILAECFTINIKSITLAPLEPSPDNLLYPNDFPLKLQDKIDTKGSLTNRTSSARKGKQGGKTGFLGSNNNINQNNSSSNVSGIRVQNKETESVYYVTDNIPQSALSSDPINTICPSTLHFGIVRTGSLHRRGLYLRNLGKHPLVFKTTYVIKSYKDVEIIKIHEDSLEGTLNSVDFSQLYISVAQFYDAIPWTETEKQATNKGDKVQKTSSGIGNMTSRLVNQTHRDTAKGNKSLPSTEEAIQQASQILMFTFMSDDEVDYGGDNIKGSHNINIEVFDPVYAKYFKNSGNIFTAKQKMDYSKKILKINTFVKAVSPKFIVKPDWILNFDKGQSENEVSQSNQNDLSIKKMIEITNIGLFPFSVALRPLQQVSRDVNAIVDEYVENNSPELLGDQTKIKTSRRTPVKGKRDTQPVQKRREGGSGSSINNSNGIGRADIGPFNIPTETEYIKARETKSFEVTYLPPRTGTDETNRVESSLSTEYIILLIQNMISDDVLYSLKDVQMLAQGKGCSSGPQLPTSFTDNIKKALKRLLNVKGIQLPSNFDLPFVRLAFSAIHFVPGIVIDPKLCLGDKISLVQQNTKDFNGKSVAEINKYSGSEQNNKGDIGEKPKISKENIILITEANNPQTGPRSVPMPSRYIEELSTLDFGFVVVDNGETEKENNYKVSKTETMRLINPYPIPVSISVSIIDFDNGQIPETTRNTPRQKQRQKGKNTGDQQAETFSLSLNNVTIPPSSEKELEITFNPHILSNMFSATVICKVIDDDLISGGSRDKKKRAAQVKQVTKLESNKMNNGNAANNDSNYMSITQPPGIKYSSDVIGKLLTFNLLGSSTMPSISLGGSDNVSDTGVQFGSLKYKDNKQKTVTINNDGPLDAVIKVSIDNSQNTKGESSQCFSIIEDGVYRKEIEKLIPKGQQIDVSVCFDTSLLEADKVVLENTEKNKNIITGSLKIITAQNPRNTKYVQLLGDCYKSVTDVEFIPEELDNTDKEVYKRLSKLILSSLSPTAFSNPFITDVKNMNLFNLCSLPANKEITIPDAIIGIQGQYAKFTIKNLCETTIKFNILPLNGISVHPVMGHLCPEASKIVMIGFKGDVEAAYQDAPMLVLVEKININLDDYKKGVGSESVEFVSESVLLNWDSDMTVIKYDEEGRMKTERLHEPNYILIEESQTKPLSLFSVPITGCCSEAKITYGEITTPQDLIKTLAQQQQPTTSRGRRGGNNQEGGNNKGNNNNNNNNNNTTNANHITGTQQLNDDTSYMDLYPFFRLVKSSGEKLEKPLEILFSETPVYEKREIILQMRNNSSSVLDGVFLHDDPLHSQKLSFDWILQNKNNDLNSVLNRVPEEGGEKRVRIMSCIQQRLALIDKSYNIIVKYLTDALNVFSSIVLPNKDIRDQMNRVLNPENVLQENTFVLMQYSQKTPPMIYNSKAIPMTPREVIQGAIAYLLGTVCGIDTDPEIKKFPPEIKINQSTLPKGTVVPKQLVFKQSIKIKKPTLGKVNINPSTYGEQLPFSEVSNILISFNPVDEGDYEEYMRFAIGEEQSLKSGKLQNSTPRKVDGINDTRLPVFGQPIVLKGSSFLPIIHVELENMENVPSIAKELHNNSESKVIYLVSPGVGSPVESKITLINPTHESYRCLIEISESLKVTISPSDFIIKPKETITAFVRFMPNDLKSVTSVVTIRIPEYEIIAPIDVICVVKDVSESVALDVGSVKFVVVGMPCEQTVNIVGGGTGGTIEYTVRQETVPSYINIYPSNGVFSIQDGQTSSTPIVVSAHSNDITGLVNSITKKSKSQNPVTSATTDDTILIDINGTKVLPLRVTCKWAVIKNSVLPKKLDFGCVWTQTTYSSNIDNDLGRSKNKELNYTQEILRATSENNNTISKEIELTNDSALPLLFVLGITPIYTSKRNAIKTVNDASEQLAMNRINAEINRNFSISVNDGRLLLDPYSKTKVTINFSPNCELSIGYGNIQAVVNVNVLMIDPSTNSYVGVNNYKLPIYARATLPKITFIPEKLDFGSHYVVEDKDTIDSFISEVMEKKNSTNEYIKTITIQNDEDVTAFIDVGYNPLSLNKESLESDTNNNNDTHQSEIFKQNIIVSKPYPSKQLNKGDTASFNVLILPYNDQTKDIRSLKEYIYVNVTMADNNCLVSYPLQLTANVCTHKICVVEVSSLLQKTQRTRTFLKTQQDRSNKTLEEITLSSHPLNAKDLLIGLRKLREDVNKLNNLESITTRNDLVPSSSIFGIKTLLIENKRSIPLNVFASVEINRIQDGGPGGIVNGEDIGVYLMLCPSPDRNGDLKQYVSELSKLLNLIMKIDIDRSAKDSLSGFSTCILDTSAHLTVLFVPRGRMLNDDIEANGVIKIWSVDNDRQTLIQSIQLGLKTRKLKE